jgi:predicted ATPase
MEQKEILTNWHVITGGPCTGKTTVVEILASNGFKTTVEHARHYIDTQKIKGKSIDEIKRNKKEFQLAVLKMQIKEETHLNTQDLVFLDRALPDALAYYKFLDLKIDDQVLEMCNKFCYKKIFILDRLPLVNDYARREDEEEQKIIHELIIDVYNSYPCPIVHVPVLPKEERVNFILNRI